MTIQETKLQGCYLIEPQLFEDHRGSFYEGFNCQSLAEIPGFDFEVKQMNCSYSKKNVLRGLHFQKQPYAQAKYVYVSQGEVLDVVVDLRKDSPTYLEHIKVTISAANKMRLYIPKGFAHGFLALSSEVQLNYFVDEYYYPDYDSGIIFNDDQLDIDWGIAEENLILSDKDKKLLTLKEIINV